LCKGAYNEPADLAMQRKADVDENYKRMSTLLLEKGTYPAFATHDPAIAERCDRMIRIRDGKIAEEGVGS
jgi:proline dehydrogenase